MRIAIEAQRIFRTNKHGMDFVALETIRSLQKLDRENEYFILVAPGEDVCLQESPNFHIVIIKGGIYPVWEQIALPKAVRRINPDLLHCTSNTAPVFCKTPIVLTLHDIIFLEKKNVANKSIYQNLGRIYRRFVVPLVLKKCRMVITVSEYEKKRISDVIHISSEKLTAIYNGYNTHFCHYEESYVVTSKYLKDTQYLFFLGNTDPKKNTAGTLKAYAIYLQKSREPKPLLLADLKESIIDEILKENDIAAIKPFLRIAGYIDNKDLPAIYSGAFAFLYTSFRESFGIPILEAMACGTPLVSSNTSAIPEIAGEGALLVDPYNPDSIAEAILHLEDENAFRSRIIEYGLERVKLFSWDKAAANLLRVYKSVNGEKK